VVIPKASDPAHLEDNFGSMNVKLTRPQLAELDRAFPAPKGPGPLEML